MIPTDISQMHLTYLVSSKWSELGFWLKFHSDLAASVIQDGLLNDRSPSCIVYDSEARLDVTKNHKEETKGYGT